MPERPAPAEGPPPSRSDGVEQAPWDHIAFMPMPAWAEDESFDPSIAAKQGAHATLLLWTRQVDAEAAAACSHNAVRLETSLAVQNDSQWRLELQPRFQQVQLHRLQVVRQGVVINQLQRERMRLLQRETQLEHLVISGSWTLLVVLDDVRPGDVIESAYTVINYHPIGAGWCETFYPLPPRHVVGRYRLRLVADASRPNMRFKATPDFPAPAEPTRADGRKEWVWLREKVQPEEPEPNVPVSAMSYSWVQVSDIPDWKSLSRRICESWQGQQGEVDLGTHPNFAPPSTVDAAAIAALIRSIQDDYRYLSIDLESGSWIPATPDTVIRQRRGDCKDLAWLATCVLRRWGVRARPVLVGTGVRGTVAALLPMSSFFNHAVVEVDFGGRPRWFDLTLRHQGGDYDTQPVTPFERGMPVDLDGVGLAEQPGPVAPSLYCVRETFCIDARKDQFSSIEVRVRAEGFQADHLRSTYALKGAKDFADERLTQTRQRYSQAIRMGELQWRDDREKNICELTEAFEAVLAISSGDRGTRSIYEAPPNQVVRFFATPEEKPRQHPWAMPFPFEIRHQVAFHSRTMRRALSKRRRWSGAGYTITLEDARLDGEWSKTSRFRIDAAAIPAAALPEYVTKLQDFKRAAVWRLLLPPTTERQTPGADWGQLPPVERGRAAFVGLDDPKFYPEAKLGEDVPASANKLRWGFEFPNLRRLWVRWLVIGGVIIAIGLLRACNGN